MPGGLETVDVPQGRSALSCSRSIGDGDASSVPAARGALVEVSKGTLAVFLARES